MMKVAGTILTLLRGRLSVAPLLPVTAAKVLCELHPCDDRVVAAHLVGCVEGNGVLLPLSVLLDLIRCGYSAFSLSLNTSALSQWGPMDETVFTALWVQLRKQGRGLADVVVSGGATDDMMQDERQEMVPRACDLDSCFLLEKIMLFMVDVGSFVRRSSLTQQALRLQLLAEALSQLADIIEPTWNRIVAGRVDGEVSREWLQGVGLLAAKCMRIYGKSLTVYHRTLSTMLLTGLEVSCEVLGQRLLLTDREALLRMRPVGDVLRQAGPLLAGLLTRTYSKTDFHSGSTERWLEAIVKLVETCAIKAMDTRLKCCSFGHCASGEEVDSATTWTEIRSYYIAIMHALALFLATYARIINQGAEQSLPLRTYNRIGVGLEAIRRMLGAATSHLTVADRASKGRVLCLKVDLTWDELGKCCDVAEVLRRLSPLFKVSTAAPRVTALDSCCTATPLVPADETITIRLRILHEVHHHLNGVATGRCGAECRSLPSVIFLQFVRAVLGWYDVCCDLGGLSSRALWSTLRVALPRQLHGASQPLWLMLLLLDDLCTHAHSWALRRGRSPNTEDNTVLRTVKEMCDNCLSYVHRHYLCDEGSVNRDSICRILHALAALRVKQGALASVYNGDLFAGHSFLIYHLRRHLLPVSRRVLHCAGSCDVSVSNASVSGECGDHGMEDISGGLCWALCPSCEINILWRSNDAPLGSLSTCHCWMRHNEPVETVVACVELFLPLLWDRHRTERGEHIMGDPFVVLRRVYDIAVRVHTDLAPFCTVSGSRPLFVTGGALSSRWKRGGAQRSSASTAFLTECHQFMLLQRKSAIQPQHVNRMLEAVLTTSPILFAYAPEFACFLLRCLVSGEGNEDGSDHGIIESADPRGLCRLLLCACATQVARAGHRPFSAELHRDEEDRALSRSVDFNEDTEVVLNLLHDVGSGEGKNSGTFSAIRRRVVQRAVNILQVGHAHPAVG